MSDNPLVIFTPSGKRGRFPVGTPVLTAARKLGVDLDSVCGARGICSKCQITPSYGEFPKHGVSVASDALSDWNAVEDKYNRLRGLPEGRRLGCQATVQSDIVIDVPPESQVHKQVVRKRAEAREITMEPATKLYYVEVQEPDMHEPSGDLERLQKALKDQWDLDVAGSDLVHYNCSNRPFVKESGRLLARYTKAKVVPPISCRYGPDTTRVRSTDWPLILDQPPSLHTCVICKAVRLWPRPAL